MEQHDDRRRIEAVGGPDEQVLWTGRPDPAKRFTRSDLWLVPFSLMWTGRSTG